MMFDPPDFPYKDLNETMKEQFGSDSAIFNSTIVDLQIREKDIVEEEPTSLLSLDRNVLNVPSDNESDLITTGLFRTSDDAILLDENTVNQFLLPAEPGNVNKDNGEAKGPDLLALHSCSICHEIFMNDNDVLEHSLLTHGNENVGNDIQLIGQQDLDVTDVIIYSNEAETSEVVTDLWLICNVCERVLSTASENETPEQLCCADDNGKSHSSMRVLSTMYLCEVCNALFADNIALDRHIKDCRKEQNKENISTENGITQNENPKEINFCFSCEVCGTQNESMEELETHSLECKPSKVSKDRKTRSNGRPNKMWNCGSCNQLFATARDLYRHKRGEDRPEGAPLTVFVCDTCDKVLGSMCALHTHMKMHRMSKPGYPCQKCGRRFNQSGHLAIHMRMHTGERPYPCDLCSKAFKVKVERDDHRRTHTGERPFSCSVCPKTFTAAARLREHARIHTDERPYRCDICGAAFRRPYARTVHNLIHTGAKPHECDICGTAFRRSGDMWKHKRTVHAVSG